MIKGNEFVKLFSEVEEQPVEEKIFSTGDAELDELLEKVYSAGIEDGYNYAHEERLYSDDEKKKEVKEDLKDRADVLLNKKELGKIAGTGAAVGGVAGLTHGIIAKSGKLRKAGRGALIGATIPTAGVYVYRKVKKVTEKD